LAVPLSTSPPYFPDDPLCANDAPTLLQLEGTGPSTDRQSSSHPHHIVSVPGRAELLIPDLGADRTWRVVHDRQTATAQTGSFTDKGNVVGTLILQGKVTYSPGSGPRHVVFHSPSLSFVPTFFPSHYIIYIMQTPI
jgi:6-phosphogluconolactonase (cycloisomerase 2 family)